MTVALSLETLHAEPSARRALTNLSLSVAKCKKIVVVTGAGISCSCGIPDFRSSDGLYALVKQQHPDAVLKGRDLFDSSLFRDAKSTAVFYTFISQLKQSIDRASPSPTHKFLKTLDAKRKLLRSYTQNIDGLEEQAGLVGSSSEQAKADKKGKGRLRTSAVRNVQLHGDIHRVRCTFCSAEFPCTSEHLASFDAGVPPDCPECLSRSKAREARLARAIKIGTLRPAIVLYDEPHPLGDDIGTIQTADLARRPDMLVIMGTSLKVHGFKKLVKEFARAVHETAPSATSAKSHAGKVIFVNKTPPGAEWEGIIDYWVEGESDTWVEKVLDDWKKMVPGDWEVQQKLNAVASGSGTGGLKVMKDLNGVVREKGKGKRKENIAPTDFALQVALSTPLPPSPPPSPSKRRTATCHYSDDEDESSPSKKRVPSSRSRRQDDDQDADELPGVLFGNATNNARASNTHDKDDVFLGSSKEKGRTRPKTRTARSAPTKARSTSRSGTAKSATKSQVDVVVAGKKRNTSRVR
ncbi:hypothetical protein PHLGIDRAFT_101690 [Phlebiopsis gigantea 11061_1 CR5-6]|uniref:Deacetylase sirtuin-type domain-containing protein n=1 Tax=Phlebiopsis gigantea (strain 11061_1 CR5-6) TaxID=745531 RepID=A0A0C3PS02_PHLG1|nr:hypothetical protein PHLGIDRAFT_101690 [Phlebiopsis gigantea 11061_1 CR5-6]